MTPILTTLNTPTMIQSIHRYLATVGRFRDDNVSKLGAVAIRNRLDTTIDLCAYFAEALTQEWLCNVANVATIDGEAHRLFGIYGNRFCVFRDGDGRNGWNASIETPSSSVRACIATPTTRGDVIDLMIALKIPIANFTEPT